MTAQEWTLSHRCWCSHAHDRAKVLCGRLGPQLPALWAAEDVRCTQTSTAGLALLLWGLGAQALLARDLSKAALYTKSKPSADHTQHTMFD